VLGGVAALVVVAELLLGVSIFSRSSMATLTPLMGVMVIAALGQAMVIGTGGIDLSVPATINLVGSIMLKATGGADDRLWSALFLVALSCAVIGLANGLLVEVMGLNAFVATLATGQLVAGATRLYRGPVLSTTRVPPALSRWARSNVYGISYVLILAAVVVIVSALVLSLSVPGRRLVASSAAKFASRLAGLRSELYRVLVYVMASLLFGLAGVLVAGQIGSPNLTLGNPYLLATVVAVVVGGAALSGGRVDPVATLGGAVFITILNHVITAEGFSSGVAMVAQGLVLALGLAIVYLVQNRAAIARRLHRHRSAHVAGETG
jgi:ribose transport system permease protein